MKTKWMEHESCESGVRTAIDYSVALQDAVDVECDVWITLTVQCSQQAHSFAIRRPIQIDSMINFNHKSGFDDFYSSIILSIAFAVRWKSIER